MQSNVNATPSKPYYIDNNQQRNICMNNTFLTPFPKKPVQYQSYYSQKESWMDKPRSLTSPLPPKPVALMGSLERYPMRRSASAPEISAYRFEKSRILIDVEKYFNSVQNNARKEIDLISFN